MPRTRRATQPSRKVRENQEITERKARRQYLKELAANKRQQLRNLPWWIKVNQDLNLSWRPFWDRNCDHCGARLLNVEPDTFCCRNGTLSLPQLPAYPPFFIDVMNRWRQHNSSFIRKLNNLFSFTAIGTTGGFAKNLGGAVAVTGRVYHRMLDPEAGAHSWRWFLYDNVGRDLAAQQLEIPQDLIDATRIMLEENNPFLRSVRSAIESSADQSYTIHLDQDAAGGEVAAIISAQNLAKVRARKIVIQRKGSAHSDFIDIFSPSYEPLQYPLLFPSGTAGWSLGNPHRITQIQWYRCRLLQESRFRDLGRLTCEYLVDMYSRVEEQRLQFLRYGRREQHRRVQGFRNQPESTDIDPSRPTLENSIPASFLGSREWSSQQVADSLALAREFGKPSLFITSTTNPQWPEIVEMLQPGQRALDIPIIVARAFHARLLNMIAWIRKNFKDVAYTVRVTEFQKRGLPHAHILLRVCLRHQRLRHLTDFLAKIEPDLTLSMIDGLVSAEMPDPVADPRLHDLVQRHNRHPYNHLDVPYSRCNKNGKCCYGFPQPIQERTAVDEYGRVHLRRRNERDRWVVSYIPALTRLMECHVHVDICFTSNAFLYLYKYLFKGVDKSRYTIGEDEPADEFRDYLAARYLSSAEAAYRVLAFEITKKLPAVQSLSLHLPGQQLGKMGGVDSSSSMMSQLLIYLARPRDDRFMNLKLVDFFQQFSVTHIPATNRRVFDAVVQSSIEGEDRRYGLKRLRKNRVCRLHLIPLRAGELFYLRALLGHKAGYSFEDFRTVDGILYPSFQRAAIELGIFADQNEVERAMEEGVHYLLRPTQLRFLFANLIADLPIGPIQLWERFQDDLCKDFAQTVPQRAADKALLEVAQYLRGRGMTLKQVGLPVPEAVPTEVQAELEFFSSRLNDYRTKAIQRRLTFNLEQKTVFETILSICQAPGPSQPMFIDGKAGRGKSYVVECLTWLLRSKEEIVLVTGSTALSVVGYDRGRTAHSTFGIPVKEDNSDISCRIRPGSAQAKLICAAKFIIWDELPMANRAAVEAVDTLLQTLKSSAAPFGGIPFLGVGDFRQVAPVVKNQYKTGVLDSSIRSSLLWPKFQVFRLHAPIRNAVDPTFSTWVDSIGEDSNGLSTIDVNDLVKSKNIEETKNWLFPPEVLAKPEACAQRAYLTTLNVDVDDFNQRVFDGLQGAQNTYWSCDAIKESEESTNLDTEDLLALMKESGIPPHQLDLKIGCVCALMRNLSTDKSLVKNTRVVITALRKYFIEVKLVRGSESTIFDIPRINFEFKPRYAPYTVIRRQYPLRLAYATTYNSCQGLTLQRVVINLRTPVFAHGQLYTAFSRVRCRGDIIVLGDESTQYNAIHNEVIQELLL